IRDDLVTGVQTCALPIYPQLVATDDAVGLRRLARCRRRCIVGAGFEQFDRLDDSLQAPMAVGLDVPGRAGQRFLGLRSQQRLARSEEGRGGEEWRSWCAR